MIRDRQVENASWKALAKRDNATERQQRKREHEKQSEIDAGIWSSSGRKYKVRKLVDQDLTSSQSSEQVAEQSRPHCEIKEQERKKNQGPGRKARLRQNEYQKATYVNWFDPLIWLQIDTVAKTIPLMGPAKIVARLQKLNPIQSKPLNKSTVWYWIDCSGPSPRWKDSILARMKAGDRAPCKPVMLSILEPYPHIVEKIIKHLPNLRDVGVSITIPLTRGIIISHFKSEAPEIFNTTHKNGTSFQFKCSDSFTCKLPVDWEDQCQRSAMRMARIIKEEDISPKLIINFNQTGSRQVPLHGEEEKIAFTLVTCITGSGELLPFQVIYKGKGARSCPKPMAENYTDTVEAGMVFEFSGEPNHWSSHKTMRSLIDNIIIPYLEKTKKRLNLPPDQKALVYLDCWSVHRSEEFRSFMKTKETICICYVPANCTSLFQPCDAGIQQPLKLICKQCCHEDVVKEVTAGLKMASSPVEVRISNEMPLLRDRTVRWLWIAYPELNHRELILKAWKGCRAGAFDLSFECLTGREMGWALWELRTTDPTFHAELLSASSITMPLLKIPDNIQEDNVDGDYESDIEDDSSVPVHSLIACMIGSEKGAESYVCNQSGALQSATSFMEVQGTLDGQSAGKNEGNSVVIDSSRRLRKPSSRLQAYAKNAEWWDQEDESK
ncbi:hypothetical protein M422DRAFT_251175 [Sphaerobolus stellatus SS14]|uniref:DDE-1 domain-containing protein n=1 Tax=Sphaerobolus stellatus (strain SS14) TaxID=990650 RepID=A0A0C9W1L1_SPHS4|nr:hypothetical protein M422DRAFT_251175 [Sphaerobolus stellatus SS14]